MVQLLTYSWAFLRSWARASTSSARLAFPRAWVPRRFLANLRARFKVAPEPTLMSSIMRFSYGAYPTTSLTTSRQSFLEAPALRHRLGLAFWTRLVTTNPLLRPNARPVLGPVGLST